MMLTLLCVDKQHEQNQSHLQHKHQPVLSALAMHYIVGATNGSESIRKSEFQRYRI